MQATYNPATRPLARQPALIVFSRSRWGFIYQRPQHLLSRLAQHYRVLYIEEPRPLLDESPAYFDHVEACPNVEVLTPRTPVDAAGFTDEQLRVIKPMLDRLLRERGIDDYLAWFYSPLALPLLAELCPRAVIHDLMDEPCAPGDASSLMCEREAALLKVADLVLASGPSLYEARRDLHPNVQCLPNAVDAAHFAPPAEACTNDQDACEARRLQGCIPEPRLGFFGIIDERIDLTLVAALADADPSWQIVMAGPVLKVDPALLPRRANIHWLGMQPYSRLPRLVAGWDVCLMPFLLNDSTRYLSPAKTLEYMAAEKPVVSTALPDVISLYGDVVRVSPTRPGFIDQCREALGENAHRRAKRVMEMTQYVARFSWDSSAEAVHGLIEKQLLSRIEGPRRQEAVPPAASRRSASSHRPGMPMGRGFTQAHPGTPTAH